jgi:hypothetical protein
MTISEEIHTIGSFGMKAIFIMFLLISLRLSSYAQTLSSSNLPIVMISTDMVNGIPAEIKDEPKIPATMKIIFRPDGSRNYLADQNNKEFLNYSGKIGIEIRGSSSQLLPKKPYGLTTFMADMVTKQNVSLLGMPQENDWILNSIAYDPSLIRNYLSYNLSGSLGNYAPRCVYCEMVLNGNYQGLYILMEKIKIDDNRVNVLEMSAADNSSTEVTGGYIIKADKRSGSEPVGWTMPSYRGAVEYLFDNPKPSEITPAQKTYISSYFVALQTQLTWQNASLTNGFPSLIDIPSFIDYMLISEIASNADSYQFSTYFHKERNGKLRAGPVWDYDLTYGNDLYFWNLDRSKTNVWQFDNSDNTGSKFWKDMFDHSTFKCYLTRRWKELTAANGPLNYQKIVDKIDQYQNLISEAAIRENQKWGNSGTQSAEIMNMKSWLRERISWMNAQLTNYSDCAHPEIPQLVISKINYHPPSSKGFTSNNLEFIEVTNNGNLPVDLSGIYFNQPGFTYQFPADAVIGAGLKLVLASNGAVFQQFYGKKPFGNYTRNLSNHSEKIVLSDAFGNVIDSVRYFDEAPWPVEADSGGYFLELKDINLDNTQASNWKAVLISDLKLPDIPGEENIRIFPNPATTKITIEWSGQEIETYELLDITGRQIKIRNKIRSTMVDIDVSGLAQQVYLLKVITRNGNSSIHKISIIR